MPIVDAQIHLWSGGVPTSASHRQVEAYTAEEALRDMDEAGVDAAIIHPPISWDPNARQQADEAALAHPDRLAILGSFALDQPESRDLIDGWKSRPGMLGLRFTLNGLRSAWLTDGTLDWLWDGAERAGVPIAITSFLPAVGQVAERHPGLKLLIDHYGRPSGTKDEAAWGNLPELLDLAKYPNIAVKATGAPSYSSESYPFANIHAYLHRTFDAFGPQRFFWGTDVTRMPCSWRQCLTLFTQEMPWLSEVDKTLVMGQAVCDWLNWQPSGRAPSNA